MLLIDAESFLGDNGLEDLVLKERTLCSADTYVIETLSFSSCSPSFSHSSSHADLLYQIRSK